MSRPRLGRPALPRGTAATERVELRLTPTQRAAWSQAAAISGLTIKAWLVEAAERAIAKPQRATCGNGTAMR